MPYDNLDDVQKEAYVNSDSDLITMSTLEIDHADFSQPIRVVRDRNALTGVKTAAGASITFAPFWFEFVPPELTGDPDPTFDISVANATGELTQYLEIATESVTPITVIYRTYLVNMLTGAKLLGGLPSSDEMTMESYTVSTQGNMAVFTIVMSPIANQSFPSYTYNPDDFPGLLAT